MKPKPCLNKILDLKWKEKENDLIHKKLNSARSFVDIAEPHCFKTYKAAHLRNNNFKDCIFLNSQQA